MTSQPARTSFTAEVELYLHVDGRCHSATHVGEDFVILAMPADLKPGPAMVEVIVDGKRFCSETSITSTDHEHRRVNTHGGSLSPAKRIAI